MLYFIQNSYSLSRNITEIQKFFSFEVLCDNVLVFLVDYLKYSLITL